VKVIVDQGGRVLRLEIRTLRKEVHAIKEINRQTGVAEGLSGAFLL
jgi:hypothetical protein